MGAKAKLNAAYFHGAVLMAALLGWLAGSWTAFLIALGVLVVANILAGDIRR